MNILYLGPYRTESGWGTNSLEYIECLVETEHNIACKPVFMSNETRNTQLSNKVLEAENKVFDSMPDVVIQHALPDLFQKIDNTYNIGIFDTETVGIPKQWSDKINLLDEAIVDSEREALALKQQGNINIPVSVLHASLNINNYQPEYNEEFNKILEILGDSYVFYFIGENTDRKNILSIVMAFHLAFNKNDNVKLLIKTNNNMLDEINKSREIWRIKNTGDYIPEICISSKLTYSQMANLHQRCNCLVVPSYGESLCYPIVEALLFNNRILCNKNIFSFDLFKEYITGINSYEIPVNTNKPPLPHLYTANETWFQIDVLDMKEKMLATYKEKEKPKYNSSDFIKQQFSRSQITKKLNEYFKQLSEKINKK